ncbi:class I SAM-dependent methyltransferase [Ruegeria lacuscaerulensis]|uniref:class I SAM-dependent methyltransferase n=1 Tax=Ruegeria lacuscaerulensis TaxID=55218 RepID=UPI001481C541|nr:class I SAM-dependent methyltransferase [Ruegeria lacuscaerulensis]
MHTPNEEQAEYWGKSPSGVKWLTYEDQLDHVFTPVLDLVLSRANIVEGMRVLDIGCGTGVSSLAAAKRVGGSGHVQSADISQAFLDRAQERARAENLTNMSFLCADAQTQAFPEGEFDAAISRFGVMFFQDSVAAFRNIASALKPGGQMTFAAWGPLAGNPWFKIPHVSATARLGNPPKYGRFAPGPLAFHDLDHVAGMMNDAGLTDIKADPVPLSLPGFNGVPGTAALCTRVGPAARVIGYFNGTDEDVAAIEADVAKNLEQFDTENGIEIPAIINLFQARRAA